MGWQMGWQMGCQIGCQMGCQMGWQVGCQIGCQIDCRVGGVPVRLRLSAPGNFSVPVYFLFGESMLMNLGFFMLIPMLSIHYLSLGMSALFVGNLYAVRILSQQGLQLFGGNLADRFPYKWIIFIGCIIRSAGFALFAILPGNGALYGAAILFGIGGALFGPAGNAAMAALTPAPLQSRAFTIRQAFSNIGTTVGPVLGAFLVYGHFTLICLVAGVLFAGIGLVGLFVLPGVRSGGNQPAPLKEGVRVILRNRLFLMFVALFMGYYFIYQQMYIAIPDWLQALHAPKEALGELFSAEAILEIAVTYPVIALSQRYHAAWTGPRLMSAGMYIMGASWVPLLFHVSVWTLLIPVLGLAVGSVVSLPSRQSYTAGLAESRYVATYFGVASMSMAIGASVGASGGGWIMHVALGDGIAKTLTPWPALLFCLLSVVCGYGLSRLPVHSSFADKA